jgi:hypothetical protein
MMNCGEQQDAALNHRDREPGSRNHAIFARGGERGLIVEGSRIVELAAGNRARQTLTRHPAT